MAHAPKILNAKRVGRNPPGAVYVGRPSPWGNPFSIGRDGDREEVIFKYLSWLHENPVFVERARRDLAGRDLVCWCAPEACHAEILRDLALGLPLPPIPEKCAPRQGDLFGGPV
jgi:hypothetical protein